MAESILSEQSAERRLKTKKSKGSLLFGTPLIKPSGAECLSTANSKHPGALAFLRGLSLKGLLAPIPCLRRKSTTRATPPSKRQPAKAIAHQIYHEHPANWKY